MSTSREGYLWTKTTTSQGLTTDSVVLSATNIKSEYDAIVIGAGFAGLLAARELSRNHGLQVLLVEGRDRIGGRTWTAKALGEEFEMGGTWVHWNQPHCYRELYKYNLHKNFKTSAGTLAAQKTYYRSAQGAVQEVDPVEFGNITQAVAESFFTIDGHSSRELMPYPHDPFREPALWKKYDHLSVRQRLDQLDLPSLHKEYFETTAASFGSAPGKDIGFVEALRWYALGAHNLAQTYELAGVFKLGKGGMTSFARALHQDAKCDTLMNTVVTDISHHQSGARITTAKGQTLAAKAVVCTVPLNCLSDVKFSPSLHPIKQEAISHGHINKGAKIHFKLAETEPGWFAACNGDDDSSFCFSFSDHNGNSTAEPQGTYSIGFGYNGYLEDPKNSEVIIREFNRNVRPGTNVEAYLTHDWMNDPLAKGVWSCWGPGAMSKYTKALQESHGNVFFASADWADGWRGFIDGALESGLKTANEVVKHLDARLQSKL
ncbi:hypothetical protein LTR84_011879 [Exophiala bonariae]|uniref:Amine oxidase n=1 Tax=Exophiala bonariae TaxID=1690606 RepID=A0AAV9NKW1_9EURO|nr:hypothetical protein LTR84_011879 [Exophiala bonariae]